MYGFVFQDLMHELNSEWVVSLSFAFKQLLRALFMTPVEFDVSSLKSTIKGLGTDEKVRHFTCLCILSSVVKYYGEYIPCGLYVR